MMSGLARLHAEARRLQILTVLSAEPGCMCSDALLQAAIELYGLVASIDQTRADLGWLEEQALVVIERTPVMHVAKLTARGLDAAAGRCNVPGVARPRPE